MNGTVIGLTEKDVYATEESLETIHDAHLADSSLETIHDTHICIFEYRLGWNRAENEISVGY